MSTEFKVYWTKNDEPNYRDFKNEEMGEALKWCEHLRNERAMGHNISFITLASEQVDSVTLDGVAAPKSDYHWTKRRTLALKSDKPKE